MDFNPRSPCGERQPCYTGKTRIIVFQSTLPVRGATQVRLCLRSHQQISIHAPRAGSDKRIHPQLSRLLQFQSTLPVRGATTRLHARHLHGPISIHAPRAGSDARLACSQACKRYFNPRSPCGERQQYCTNLLRSGGNIATWLPNDFSADGGKIVVSQQKTFFNAVSGARTSRTFYVYRRFASGGRSEDQCIGHIN